MQQEVAGSRHKPFTKIELWGAESLNRAIPGQFDS